VRTNTAEAGKGFVQLEVSTEAELEAADVALLAEGWATLTALEPICVSHAEAFETIFSTTITA